MTLRNPGGTASTPLTLLLYVSNASELPFGPPICTACNSTAGRKVTALEWPALAAGETRTVSVDLPVTAAAGSSAFSAGLYAAPMTDVVAAEIASGIEPGQQVWTVTLTVSTS